MALLHLIIKKQKVVQSILRLRHRIDREGVFGQAWVSGSSPYVPVP
jgi:hypothetical protein